MLRKRKENEAEENPERYNNLDRKYESKYLKKTIEDEKRKN